MEAVKVKTKHKQKKRELPNDCNEVIPEIPEEINVVQELQDAASENVGSDVKADEEEKIESATSEIAQAPEEVANEEDASPEEPINLVRLEDDSAKVSEHRELYPQLPAEESSELQRKPSLRPYTESQLAALYKNTELELLETFTSQYVEAELKGISVKRHLLYELLTEYLRVREKNAGITLELNQSWKEYNDCKNLSWTLENASVSEHGKCEDGTTVSTSVIYNKALFHRNVFNSVVRMLTNINTLVNRDHTLYSFSAEDLRHQIELCVQRTISNCVNASQLAENSPVSLSLENEPPHLHPFLSEIRLCISVLFCFQRRAIRDSQFIKETREWLSRLIAVLLRLANYQDHLFILSHILRCPGGVCNWAAAFVQTPLPEAIGETPFACYEINHVVCVLALMLAPIEKREQFLENLAQSREASNGSAWVMVDSDGEEDEESSGASLRENDLVGLLNQLRLDDVFRSVLLVEKRDYKDVYDSTKISEYHILKFLSFSTVLVKILYRGLKTYNQPRYQQFAKRLSRFIRHVVQYGTDVWEQFKRSTANKDDAMLLRIQTEYDAFFLRATYYLYSSQKLGAWQFLAVVPYNLVSTGALWKLFYFLHDSDALAESILKFEEDVDYKLKLWDPEVRTVFEEKLGALSDAEIYYLLNAFANMALARDDPDDMVFVRAATLDLLHVGFMNESTQESCSKSSRILLTHITSKHPHLLSEILQVVRENMDTIGFYSLYLYEELPLAVWKPTEPDMRHISHLLLNHSATQDESRLARMILSRMNWGFTGVNTKELFLPRCLHREVAVLAIEAAEKEPAFEHWAWQTLTRLRLHVNDQGVADFTDVPDVSRFSVVSKGVREQRPLACFAAVLMATWGHMVPLVCTEGLKQLALLQAHQKHEGVLFALHLIVPLFVGLQELLINSETYQEVLVGLLSADRTYMSLAMSLVSSQSTILTQFGNMIEAQICNYDWYGLESPRLLVRLWTNSLISVPGWNKNDDVLYLLGVIIRAAFFYADAFEAVAAILRDLMQETPSEQSGSITSLFKWVSQGNSPRGNLITSSLLTHSWLAYVLINLEHEECERRSGLWFEILTQLRIQKGKVNVDAAIKKAASVLKQPSFSSGVLCLYRWAQQAIDSPMDHPLLPLLWQKFFFLYLARVPVPADGVSDAGCVGAKFFEGLINFTFLKRMKRRLQDTIAFYQKLVSDEEDDSEQKVKYEHYACLFQAYALWLEEPRLQDVNLHLASLPAQYYPQLLARIVGGDSTPWVDYVDYEAIKSTQESNVKTWNAANFRDKRNVNMPLANAGKSPESADPVVRILRRLASYDAPKAPPELALVASVVDPIDFGDESSMFKSLEPFFRNLRQFAVSHNLHTSQIKALDCSYQDLVPQLYRSVLKKVEKRVPCKGPQNAVLCSGPAKITLHVQESVINERVEHQIESNRSEYKLLINKSLQAPAKSLLSASVNLQHTIRFLQAKRDDPRFVALGVELFYKILALVNGETMAYVPTKVIYGGCLQKLGESHISSAHLEMPRLLKKIFEEPKHGEFLVPHFCTTFVDSPNLLFMYRTISEKVCQKCDVHFALLTKFDIHNWLANRNPKISQRSELLKTIVTALSALGFEPAKPHLKLHEIYRQHLLRIFEFQFPEHYGEVLVCLLNASNEASETGSIAVSVWMDVLNSISRPVQLRLSGTHRDQLRQYAQHQRMLHHRELLETSALLARHFTNERLQYGLYGLYPRCRNYVDVFGLLLGMTGHSLIVSALNTHEGVLGDKLCEIIWPYLRDMFAPWLVPYSVNNLKENMASWIQQLADDRQVILPWIAADAGHAQKILTVFLECILFVTHTLPGCSTILSYVWQWYVASFAYPSVKEHALNPVHTSLLALPWHNFWPSLTDLELMHRVIEQYVPECHVFLGHIFVSLSWPQWMANVKAKISGPVAAKVHHCLLYLFVKLANDPKVRASHAEKIKMLLVQAENFDWRFVEPPVLQQVADWYVMSCDSLVIFKSDPLDLDVRVFNFLKVVSGYDRKLERPDAESLEKRRIFVRAFVKLFSVFTNRHKSLVASKRGELETMVRSQLTQMEAVMHAEDELKVILGEFLCVLNFSGADDAAEKSVLAFLREKPGDGAFVRQLMRTAAVSVVDCNFVAILLETAVSVYFRNRGVESAEEACWDEVARVVEVYPPRLSELEKAAVMHGCLLLLNALLIKNINKSYDQIFVINSCLDWLENVKITESVEPKMPLLWTGILRLAVQISKDAVTATALHRFANILTKHSEEKGASWTRGLLGAIGIGKQPLVSLEFRFLSRALAGYVLAQLPDRKGDVQMVRREADAAATVGQPGGNTECVKLLLGLDFGQNQGKIKECAEFALKQIQSPGNSLGNSRKFLSEITKQLFSKPYLKEI